MLLPNSNAHSAMAPQKPSTMAAATQRSGHGIALRTAMRGALMVRRRRSSLKRIGYLELDNTVEKKSRDKRTCAALFRQ